MIPFAFWLACGLSSALSCRVALQYFQLESYQFGGYFRTLQRNWLRAFLPGFAVALWGCAAVTLCASLAFADWTLWMGLAITLAGAVAAWVLQRRLPAKKPLVFTARVKRLCLWLLAVCLGASAALAFGGRLLTACLLLPALALVAPAVPFLNYAVIRAVADGNVITVAGVSWEAFVFPVVMSLAAMLLVTLVVAVFLWRLPLADTIRKER